MYMCKGIISFMFVTRTQIPPFTIILASYFTSVSLHVQLLLNDMYAYDYNILYVLVRIVCIPSIMPCPVLLYQPPPLGGGYIDYEIALLVYLHMAQLQNSALFRERAQFQLDFRFPIFGCPFLFKSLIVLLRL